jgi:chromate transport protein ChrA
VGAVPFGAAACLWLRIGCISFGGPVGQIAILHREVVETHRWVDDAEFAREAYAFFTQAALVTFGGAYAVLAYVNQQLVDVQQWLTHADVVAGLALAETTPGPLVLGLQFYGFVAGWTQPGALAPLPAATLTALATSWATFLPSFVLILVGAPYVERIAASVRLAGMLEAVTALVVGVHWVLLAGAVAGLAGV